MPHATSGLFGWLYTRPQRRAVALLDAQSGERVFVPGVGTGMGLAELPMDAHITAIDLSPAMLAEAQRKLAGRVIDFEVMDAQHVRFPDASFDAVLLEPDPVRGARRRRGVPRGVAGAAAGRPRRDLRQVPARDSGPEAPLSLGRRAIGAVLRIIGTDPNRRLSQLIAGAPGLVVEQNEPSLLRGQYRIVLLRKQ